MMFLIFVILLFTTVFAWKGHRNSALIGFSITLLLSTVLFIQDMTTALNLQF
ncbi:MAG TPA: DUF5993 family protein [Gammaproteobacteria bacterium]|nr:DUF5993 family protein [Gammaproteobacteria bacterium]